MTATDNGEEEENKEKFGLVTDKARGGKTPGEDNLIP